MVKGVLHLHSRHSDGELTVAELRAVFLAAGCRFACITDHADAFDAARLVDYRQDCTAHSDQSFLFIPGLEFSCRDRMHVLGYGVTALVASDDPEIVIAHIRRQGGIAVIAHPRETAFGGIERFEPLPDGIEAWNTKYDGRFAPRLGTFELLARVQQRQPSTKAFYGQDLHWRSQARALFVRLNADAVTRDAVLDDLRHGRFVGVKGALELPSDGRLPIEISERFGRVHDRYDKVRGLGKRSYGWLKSLGIARLLVPAPIKTQLRRLF